MPSVLCVVSHLTNHTISHVLWHIFIWGPCGRWYIQSCVLYFSTFPWCGCHTHVKGVVLQQQRNHLDRRFTDVSKAEVNWGTMQYKSPADDTEQGYTSSPMQPGAWPCRTLELMTRILNWILLFNCMAQTNLVSDETFWVDFWGQWGNASTWEYPGWHSVTSTPRDDHWAMWSCLLKKQH